MLIGTQRIYLGFSHVNKRDLYIENNDYRSCDLCIVAEQARTIFVQFAELSPVFFVSGMCAHAIETLRNDFLVD